MIITLTTILISACSCCNSGFPQSNKEGWEDLRFPASAVKVTGSLNLPYWDSFIDGTQALWFEQGDQVFAIAQIPHARKNGTDLLFHFHWTGIEKETEPVNVTWCVEYTNANIEAIFGRTITRCVNDTYDGVPFKHHMTDQINVSGFNVTESAIYNMRLYRDNDDYEQVDIILLEFDIHYYANKFGGTLH